MTTNAAEYMKEWRKTPGGQAALKDQKRREKAKRRAQTELASLYSNEFTALFKKHLKQVEAEEAI